MRTATAYEEACLQRDAAEFDVWHKVEVEDADGAFQDLTDLLGYDWTVSVSGGWTIDQPVPEFTIEIGRGAEGEQHSLAPFMERSAANVDSTGAYAPLIDVGRLVKIYLATVEHGRQPGSSDWKQLPTVGIDRYQVERDPIQLTTRSTVMAELVDRWVEEETTYGAAGGRALESVLQDVLDDWTAAPTTLYSANGTAATPWNPSDSPGTTAAPSSWEGVSVYQVLTDYLQKIGWALGLRWNSDVGDYVLTAYEPDRSNTTADWTFGPDDYDQVRSLNVDRANIRNKVVVSYPDAASGDRATYTAEDATSQNKYSQGYPLWMQLTEGDDSPVDDSTKAQAEAEACLSDLKDPIADQEVGIIGAFWPAELGDLYAFDPNGVHYSSQQKFAVTGIRFDLSPTSHRTYLRTRGNPAGQYLSWLRKAAVGAGSVAAVITSIGVSFDTDNQVVVSLAGNDLTRIDGAGISFYITVETDGSEPADPLSATNDGYAVSTDKSATISTSVVCDPEATAWVKACAVNAAGRLGPVKSVKVVNQRAGSGTIGGLTGQWVQTAQNVSNAAPATLKDGDRVALAVADGKSYTIICQNTTSGSGETTQLSLDSDGASWAINGQTYIDGSGPCDPTNDHPEIFLDGGVPKVRLHGGSNVDDVEIHYAGARALGTPDRQILVGITDPTVAGKLASGTVDANARTLTDMFDKTGDTLDDVPDGTVYALINRGNTSGGDIIRGADGWRFEGSVQILDTDPPDVVDSGGSASSLTKTLRIAALNMLPSSNGASWSVDSGSRAAISAAATGTTLILYGNVLLPPGVTVTQVAARLYRGTGGSDQAQFWFYRGDNSGSTPTTLANGTAAGTGAWQTVTDTLSETISASYFYTWHIQVEGTALATDGSVLWIDFTYDMPSFDKAV